MCCDVFTAVPDPPMIVNVTRVPDSSYVTIFWKEPQNHGCYIWYYCIHYRVIKDSDNEKWPWDNKCYNHAWDKNIQQAQFLIILGQRYEMRMTARNSEGDSSMELAIPTIVDLRIKEPHTSRLFI